MIRGRGHVRPHTLVGLAAALTGFLGAGFLAATGGAFLTTTFLAAGFLATAGLPEALATGLAAGLATGLAAGLLVPKTIATFVLGAACKNNVWASLQRFGCTIWAVQF